MVSTAWIAPVQADEEQLPLWELGVGGGVVSLPQYIGSDERYTLPAAFPYIIYRGERWRLDRSGLRNRLIDKDRLSVDISLSGGLPVRNSNRARAGMPELFLTGELGPKVSWRLSESETGDWSLHLPSRAAINIRGKYVGWVTDPYVRYEYHKPVREGALRIRVDTGIMYASQRYHDNYYTVLPVYATAIRPAYQARGGLNSAFVKLRVRYPLQQDLELFTSLQARSLAIGVIKDSPLVKSRLYGSAAIGLIWVFKKSEEMVRGE